MDREAAADLLDAATNHGVRGRDDVLAALRALRVLLTGEDGSADDAVAWGLARLPAAHHPVIAGEVDDHDALSRFRWFVVGAAVRKRPGRRVGGLP